MTAPSKAPPPLEAASWPFNCLSFYNHMARDFGRYAQTVSKTTDPVEAARAEGDFGMSRKRQTGDWTLDEIIRSASNAAAIIVLRITKLDGIACRQEQ